MGGGSCGEFSMNGRGGGITAFDALAAFDRFDALGSMAKFLVLSSLCLVKKRKRQEKKV